MLYIGTGDQQPTTSNYKGVGGMRTVLVEPVTAVSVRSELVVSTVVKVTMVYGVITPVTAVTDPTSVVRKDVVVVGVEKVAVRVTVDANAVIMVLLMVSW